MKSEKIVALIKDGKEEIAFKQIYSYLHKIEALIIMNNGTKEEAKDIFQDALVILYSKVSTPTFKLDAHINTYLYSTCKFLWYNQLRKKKIEISDDFLIDSKNYSSTIEIDDIEKWKQAEVALKRLSNKCLEILKLFYHETMCMSKIATIMQFSSEKSARNQKYKCLEKAKKEYLNLTSITE